MPRVPRKTPSSKLDHEPTLHDVLEVLSLTNQKIDDVKDAVLTVNGRVDGVEVRLGTLERNVEKIKGAVADVQDDLTSALAALDTDSVMVLDHEQRIKRLEKRMV